MANNDLIVIKKNNILDITIKNPKTETTIDRVLEDIGISLDMPCAGRGRCGKCKVTIKTNSFEKEVLGCQYILTEDDLTNGALHISLGENQIINGAALEDTIKNKEISDNDYCSLAVDIGTTTVEVSLLKEESLTVLDTKSSLNPQKQYGADIISRISFCNDDNNLRKLSELIRNHIAGYVDYYSRSGYKIENIYISGNTTMQHIFCNVSPGSIGVFPFTPQFVETKTFLGKEIGINVKNVVVLPSCDGYIGADIVSGVLSTGLFKEPNALLLDLGTNGEMVISYEEDGAVKMKATSSAAGPCLEGANISQGMGGQDGAISQVFFKHGTLYFKTIGDAEPVGLCGAGLVDLVSVLVENGTIEENGFMEEDYEIFGVQLFNEGRSFSIPYETGVTLTRKDVRELQLAKSAIRAGVEILVNKANLKVSDIEKLIIAGGLGQHINPVSAMKIGMIPKINEDKLIALGNTSLKGTILACDEKNIEMLENISKEIKPFSLNEEKSFSEKYIEYISF